MRGTFTGVVAHVLVFLMGQKVQREVVVEQSLQEFSSYGRIEKKLNVEVQPCVKKLTMLVHKVM